MQELKTEQRHMKKRAAGNSTEIKEVSEDLATSPAIRRLLEEVRSGQADGIPIAGKYDRVHNRHNR